MFNVANRQFRHSIIKNKSIAMKFVAINNSLTQLSLSLYTLEQAFTHSPTINKASSETITFVLRSCL